MVGKQSVSWLMGCVGRDVRLQLDICPVGSRKHRTGSRKRFMGKPEYVENFMRFIAQELREYMAALGIRKVNDLIGRTDLLKIKDGEEEKANTLILVRYWMQVLWGDAKKNKFNPK